MRQPIFAILLGAASLFVPAKAHACTCEVFGDGTPQSTMRHAKAVFVGEVLRVRPATKAEREDGSNAFIVTLRIESSWKGKKSGEIDVQTDMTGCGPYFRVGEKFLVYGMRKQLNTACSGTRKLEAAEKDLKALGPGRLAAPR